MSNSSKDNVRNDSIPLADMKKAVELLVNCWNDAIKCRNEQLEQQLKKQHELDAKLMKIVYAIRRFEKMVDPCLEIMANLDSLDDRLIQKEHELYKQMPKDNNGKIQQIKEEGNVDPFFDKNILGKETNKLIDYLDNLENMSPDNLEFMNLENKTIDLNGELPKNPFANNNQNKEETVVMPEKNGIQNQLEEITWLWDKLGEEQKEEALRAITKDDKTAISNLINYAKNIQKINAKQY